MTAIDLLTLRSGSGLPLLLLHAFPVDHRMWSDVATAMPGNPQVFAVDLPGLGQSPLGGEPASLADSADAVAEALTGHGVRRAVVAGLSMGGYVALALADRHPELIAGLGLVDTKSTADADEAQANRLRIAAAVDQAHSVDPVLGMAGTLLGKTSKTERKHLTARVEEWIRAQRPAGVAWSQRAMAARPDRTHVIAELDVPVAVVVGTEDQLTPIGEAEHMAEASGGPLVRVPRAGHLSAVEEPVAVAVALAELLAVATAATA